MDNVELKEWMQDKFESQNSQLKGIKDDLATLSCQVTSHDRWLWLLKGMGAIIILLLGFIGIKVKVI
jgi:hypothetical protein